MNAVETGIGPDDVDLAVQVGQHRFASPLLAASGCGGFGHELATWGGLPPLGALVTPSLTVQAHTAVDAMRIIESPSGVCFPHDVPNVGADSLTATKLPWEVCAPTPVIVSVAGATTGDIADAVAAVRRRTAMRGLVGVEVNLSLPNEAASGRVFARDEYAATKAVARAREQLPRNVLLAVKLVLGGEIVEIARGVLKSGADAIVLGHPPAAVAIDPVTLRAQLGGRATFAGPALLPMTLGAVHELRTAMDSGRLPRAPIIAGGGVARTEDVIAALAAGANAVQIGSALLRDPQAAVRLTAGLRDYCSTHRTTPAALVGAAHR